jgi:ribosomal-protein-alanine N-acetyltransferase
MDSLQTARLSLSALTETDAGFILQLVNTEGWLAFIGDRNVHTEEDALVYVKKIIADPNYKYWVVRIKNTAEPIGTVSFIQRNYLDHPDIGYAFMPHFGKKGYALEAASAVMDHLVADPAISTILATVRPGNVNSIRLLEKLGLHFVKQIEVDGNEPLLYQYSNT